MIQGACDLTRPPPWVTRKLLCAPVFFWGKVHRIPQISQEIYDRNRGGTNEPGPRFHSGKIVGILVAHGV